VVVRIDTVRMSLFSMRVFVVSVRMTAMTVVVEKEKTADVRQETAGADDEDDLGVGDVLWLDEPLDRFEEDGETERDEEDAVDERTQSFGTLPLRAVSRLLAHGL
jgi:hypothetical protein